MNTTTSTLAATLAVAAFSFAAVGQDDTDKVVSIEERQTEQIFREFLEDEAHELSLNDLENRNIFELVDMIMMVRISKELNLDDAGCIEFYRKIGNLLDKVHRLKWERGSTQFYIRNAIEKGEPSKVIAEKLERALDIDREIDAGVREMIHAASSYLSSEQAAKLFLFSGDFESEIKDLIGRAEAIAKGEKPVPKDAASIKPGPAEKTKR